MEELIKRCSKCGRKAGEMVKVGDRMIAVKFQKTSFRYKNVKHSVERGDCNICRMASQKVYNINTCAYQSAKRQERRLKKKGGSE